MPVQIKPRDGTPAVEQLTRRHQRIMQHSVGTRPDAAGAGAYFRKKGGRSQRDKSDQDRVLDEILSALVLQETL